MPRRCAPDLGMSPAEKMRVARRIVAHALGVDELPPEAIVESAVLDGVLHLRTALVVAGAVREVRGAVRFRSEEYT